MKARPDLNQQLAKLRQARSDLAAATHDARDLAADLHPKTVITRSVKRHPWRWALGGGLAGWILLRLVIPGKSRFGSKKSFTKGSLLGMIVASAGGLLRIPAEEFMRRRVRAMFEEPTAHDTHDGVGSRQPGAARGTPHDHRPF